MCTLQQSGNNVAFDNMSFNHWMLVLMPVFKGIIHVLNFPQKKIKTKIILNSNKESIHSYIPSWWSWVESFFYFLFDVLFSFSYSSQPYDYRPSSVFWSPVIL